MGSCVSKKAARAGAGAGAKGKVAAPLPVAEKESAHALLPPVLEVAAEAEVDEEEEVKEVVLSETPAPRPPRPPPEPVKRRREQPEADDDAATASSETCSASDSAASVASAAKEKAKLHKAAAGGERELGAEKRAVDALERAKTAARRTTAPEERERENKHKGGGGVTGHGRARSPSPSSAHGRQGQQHPPAPRPPRREQPAVVSGIGCRSGRFSPSAARSAAESAAVRRTHSAREAEMALPSSCKRPLSLSAAAIVGHGNVVAGHGGGSALSRRDPGERSGRRSDSPTGGRRAPAFPSPSAAIHRPASPMRKVAAAKEHGTPERASRRPPRVVRDGGLGDGDEPAALSGGGEQKKVAEGEENALGQNPSVAMECFIFL